MQKKALGQVRPKKKYLIVNADDFGLSAGINRAIIKAHESGILTSATLMANMPATEQAVTLSEDNPSLGVGLHLNFLRGAPLTPPEKIRSLLNSDGRFVQRAAAFIGRILAMKIDRDELRRELSAQVEKILNLGVAITHFDSEKNLHFLPLVADVVIRVAQEYGIKAIRYPEEGRLAAISGQSAGWFSSQGIKRRLLSRMAKRAYPELRQAGLCIPDYFWGVKDSGKMDERAYAAILPWIPGGVTEIMTHPGFVDQELESFSQTIGGFYINRFRETEYHGLVAPALRTLINNQKIKLISYRDLPGLQGEKS